MTTLEITLIIIGVVFLIGSFMVNDKLSHKDLDKIADMSAEELKIITEKEVTAAKKDLSDALDEEITQKQEKKALDKLQSGARQQETDGKLVEISYEELKNGKAHEKIKELPDEVPVYISVDKDVLDEKYAVTNWDQGKMSMGMLEQILKTLVTEYDVIGVDICGMYPEENSLPEYLRAERVNIRSDEELYRFLQMSLLKKKELLSL